MKTASEYGVELGSNGLLVITHPNLKDWSFETTSAELGELLDAGRKVEAGVA